MPPFDSMLYVVERLCLRQHTQDRSSTHIVVCCYFVHGIRREYGDCKVAPILHFPSTFGSLYTNPKENHLRKHDIPVRDTPMTSITNKLRILRQRALSILQRMRPELPPPPL